MFAEMNPIFAEADVQYRQEHVAADLSRSRRSLRISWPTAIFRPRLHQAQTPRPIAARHHAPSAG
jgi:hypothetical protein